MSGEVQRDLFSSQKQLVPGADLCAPRHRGADTSVEAFSATPTHVRTRQRDDILHFIKQRGSLGCTCSEVEDALSLSHQAASARITELHALGLIAFSDDRRKTKSGRPARVYRARSEREV